LIRQLRVELFNFSNGGLPSIPLSKCGLFTLYQYSHFCAYCKSYFSFWIERSKKYRTPHHRFGKIFPLVPDNHVSLGCSTQDCSIWPVIGSIELSEFFRVISTKLLSPIFLPENFLFYAKSSESAHNKSNKTKTIGKMKLSGKS